jgi:hypothetical protein
MIRFLWGWYCFYKIVTIWFYDKNKKYTMITNGIFNQKYDFQNTRGRYTFQHPSKRAQSPGSFKGVSNEFYFSLLLKIEFSQFLLKCPQYLVFFLFLLNFKFRFISCMRFWKTKFQWKIKICVLLNIKQYFGWYSLVCLNHNIDIVIYII